ncbi:MAG: hypothetical protein OQL19_08475 [Gammaproteobacteria bacterium]|nr:hypothetical protein [Gammaproteobacteria bacterium]
MKLHKGLGAPNVVFLVLENDPSNKISCSTNSVYDYAFDVSTDDGKAFLGMALTAYTTGKQVSLGGRGSCSLYSSTEDINSLRLQ